MCRLPTVRCLLPMTYCWMGIDSAIPKLTLKFHQKTQAKSDIAKKETSIKQLTLWYMKRKAVAMKPPRFVKVSTQIGMPNTA